MPPANDDIVVEVALRKPNDGEELALKVKEEPLEVMSKGPLAENVLVATQIGFPLVKERINPSVEEDIFASVATPEA